jgi:hypothetical protein
MEENAAIRIGVMFSFTIKEFSTCVAPYPDGKAVEKNKLA